MDQTKNFIAGFVKQASLKGFSEEEALRLLKEANLGDWLDNKWERLKYHTGNTWDAVKDSAPFHAIETVGRGFNGTANPLKWGDYDKHWNNIQGETGVARGNRHAAEYARLLGPTSQYSAQNYGKVNPALWDTAKAAREAAVAQYRRPGVTLPQQAAFGKQLTQLQDRAQQGFLQGQQNLENTQGSNAALSQEAQRNPFIPAQKVTQNAGFMPDPKRNQLPYSVNHAPIQ
jgi:hypothetical protein